MTKYNKAQQACIDKWDGADSNFEPNMISDFINEFTAIDPRPDPLPRYSVEYQSISKDSTGVFTTVISGKPNITCKCYLLERLQETVHPETGSTKIIGVEWVDGEHLIVNEGEVVHKWTIVEDKND